jgi:hypothetical protein
MYIDPNILDFGLDYISTYVDVDLVFCWNNPFGSYADVQTYKLGVKENPTLTAISDWANGGRKVSIQPFSDGVGEVTGTVYAIALVDNNTSTVIVSKVAISSMGIVNGESFSINGVDIIIPDSVVSLFSDNVLDYGLDYIENNLEAIWIFSANPGLTYSTTNRLGYKNTPDFSDSSGDSSGASSITDYSLGGRKILISAFSDGVAEADGYARFFSLVNNTGNEIMVTGQLGRPLIIDGASVFALSEFGIAIPDELQ